MNKKQANLRIKSIEDELIQLKSIVNSPDVIIKSSEINCLEDAEKVLENVKGHTKLSLNTLPSNKYEALYTLETIIKAANYLDNNNKLWKLDWNNSNQYKYYPYFKASGSGLGFGYCYSYFSSCSASVGFYYKNEETAKLFATRYLQLYNDWLLG